jgi:hypothetical protein
MPNHPLLRKLLQQLKQQFTGRVTPPQLDPRMKAHLLVNALSDATIQCLSTQAHLFGHQPKERADALDALSVSLATGEWVPEGLNRADMDYIGYGLISDVVWAISRGQGIAGYEIKIHEYFRQQSEGVPEVRPAGDARERPRTQRRAYYRV